MVSYPRLSLMTRRNGTSCRSAYRRRADRGAVFLAAFFVGVTTLVAFFATGLAFGAGFAGVFLTAAAFAATLTAAFAATLGATFTGAFAGAAGFAARRGVGAGATAAFPLAFGSGGPAILCTKIGRAHV